MCADIETVGNRVNAQTRALCSILDLNHGTPVNMIDELLGPVAARPLTEPPLWPSDVADDHTPLEFSVAIDEDGRQHLRVLGETVADQPGVSSNVDAAERLVDSLVAAGHQLDLSRLEQVRDVFLPDDPQGIFAWWYSFIFRRDGSPNVKVYFNPAVRGAEHAPQLVDEALDRLGLSGAYATISKHALQREEDELVFFALDLMHGPSARVKVYVAHNAADVSVAERAGAAVPGIAAAQVRDFCAQLAPGVTVFDSRPLISGYSFVEGDTDAPSTYSLYLPLRSYVDDDAVARERVRQLFSDHNIEPALLDQLLAALTERRLDANRGLIAHVSLRLTAGRRGITVYLSSEAYGGTR